MSVPPYLKLRAQIKYMYVWRQFLVSVQTPVLSYKVQGGLKTLLQQLITYCSKTQSLMLGLGTLECVWKCHTTISIAAVECTYVTVIVSLFCWPSHSPPFFSSWALMTHFVMSVPLTHPLLTLPHPLQTF